MSAQIENLLKMNARLSDEATKLTRALRSNNKIAGNWGETVLQKSSRIAALKRESISATNIRMPILKAKENG